MTREERAKSLSSHLLIAAARLRRSEITRDEYDSIAKAKVEAFADAEAAAMRERAMPDRDAMIETVKGLLNQHPMVDAAQFVKDGIRAGWIVDAIRALPVTGDVGR